MWLMHTDKHHMFGRLHENGSTEQEKSRVFYRLCFFRFGTIYWGSVILPNVMMSALKYHIFKP
jgi:hypothetical protein